MKNNFNEIVKGFTEQQAIEEAKRCINCHTRPCETRGCPANVKIPDFIQAILNKNYELAYEIINKNNCLPSITGRVCAQELQCEAQCVRGIRSEPIKIGMLERFVGDYFLNKKDNKYSIDNKKVAIIGSGPTGLSCATKLNENGYDVTIFENKEIFGGVLSYGIPKYRLPQDIVDKHIDNLKIKGVKFDNLTDISYQNIKKMGYSAIFLATGVNIPKKMNIENETLNGVFYANEILYRINLNKKNIFSKTDLPKKVLVIGGGNVAMDVSRCCKRLGIPNVEIIYRRLEKDMPARIYEIEHAKKDGVLFSDRTKPIRFISDGNGYVSGMECIKMEEQIQDDKIILKEKEESNFIIKADSIIIAIGNQSDENIIKEFGLETDKNNNIIVDHRTYQTNNKEIFAGGDVVTGAKNVISAIKAGTKAGESIIKFLSNTK